MNGVGGTLIYLGELSLFSLPPFRLFLTFLTSSQINSLKKKLIIPLLPTPLFPPQPFLLLSPLSSKRHAPLFSTVSLLPSFPLSLTFPPSSHPLHSPLNSLYLPSNPSLMSLLLLLVPIPFLPPTPPWMSWQAIF